MTREEAIRKIDYGLQMETTRPVPAQMAIIGVGQLTVVSTEALKMARAALREQEKRSKGCEFCREDKDGFYQMVGSFSLSNPFHKGEYYLNCGKAKPIRIHDCPMCGRKLEVDA